MDRSFGPGNPHIIPLAPVYDTDWKIVGVSDVNADGYADILWRNSSTGDNEIWINPGLRGYPQRADSLPVVAGSDWTVARFADLNGDRMADVVWHNTTTGANEVWFLNGLAVSGITVHTSVSSAAAPSMPTTAWTVGGPP